jgi:uncharacterized RDD family membrane protein YckC
MSEAAAPTDPVGGQVQRAGFVSRLAAFVVDVVILSSMLGGAAWLLEVTARGLRRFAPPIDLVAVLTAIAPLISIAYHLVFWTTVGQTPGKWLLGIRVSRVGGGPLPLRWALLRWIGYLLSGLPFYLGFFWVLGPRRRAWHDYLARSEVVYVPEDEPIESPGAMLRRRWARRRSGAVA